MGGRGKLISAAALIRVNTLLSGITMVLSSALKQGRILEEKVNKHRGANLRKFGTFPYALRNLTFTNKLLVNDKVTVFF